MKKIILIFSIICMLFLVGCNKNGDANTNENINNESEIIIDNQQQENADNNVSTEDYQDDTAEYKLCDGYILEAGTYEYVNTYNLDENKQYKFESDNTEYVVKVINDAEKGSRVLLNDVEIPEMYGLLDGVFDFNPEDNFKELLVTFDGSVNSVTQVYRVKANNEIELIGGFSNVSLIRIDETYIFPRFIECIKERVVCGYYKYIDDKFVFVNRFLNGEYTTELSDNFTSESYTTAYTEKPAFGDSFPIYENGEKTDKFLANDSKVSIMNIRMNLYNEIEFIDIELEEDSTIYESSSFMESAEKLPAKKGTKLTLMFVPAG